MSNTFSYWNGQPVNAPVYPQMGDLSQHSAAGAAAVAAAAPGLGLASGSGAGLGGWPGQAAAAPQSMLPFAGAAGGAGGMPVGAGGPRGMPMPGAQQMGMGDPGCMGGNNTMLSFYGQGANQFEPCIDNGEAFCAYNGMDMSMNYGGGSASKGGFW
ncbi:alanine and glycine-rich protein [Drosophila santomea]|uniref:alanine and glycine-rich protein n=1 Tax=Drosophila santomea TaxID=129105 RepID=UPI001953DB06|nr:alanine and glycine-rich protein [Drosophila santomea]